MIRAVYLWSHRLLTLSSHSYAYLYGYLHGSILKFMCCSFSQVEQCIHFITMCFWIWPFYFTSNSPKAMKKSSCGYFIYTDETFRCFFLPSCCFICLFITTSSIYFSMKKYAMFFLCVTSELYAQQTIKYRLDVMISFVCSNNIFMNTRWNRWLREWEG